MTKYMRIFEKLNVIERVGISVFSFSLFVYFIQIFIANSSSSGQLFICNDSCSFWQAIFDVDESVNVNLRDPIHKGFKQLFVLFPSELTWLVIGSLVQSVINSFIAIYLVKIFFRLNFRIWTLGLSAAVCFVMIPTNFIALANLGRENILSLALIFIIWNAIISSEKSIRSLRFFGAICAFGYSYSAPEYLAQICVFLVVLSFIRYSKISGTIFIWAFLTVGFGLEIFTKLFDFGIPWRDIRIFGLSEVDGNTNFPMDGPDFGIFQTMLGAINPGIFILLTGEIKSLLSSSIMIIGLFQFVVFLMIASNYCRGIAFQILGASWIVVVTNFYFEFNFLTFYRHIFIFQILIVGFCINFMTERVYGKEV